MDPRKQLKQLKMRIKLLITRTAQFPFPVFIRFIQGLVVTPTENKHQDTTTDRNPRSDPKPHSELTHQHMHSQLGDNSPSPLSTNPVFCTHNTKTLTEED
ncbi:hypothetical protein ABFS83_01G095600 [Erythranthe nasuta]